MGFISLFELLLFTFEGGRALWVLFSYFFVIFVLLLEAEGGHEFFSLYT
jgi:hypothetical protein